MLSQRRYSSVKSRIERNGRDKEKINASKNAHHKKERTHARLFADMGANFIFDFIRACPWRRIRHAKRKNRSFRRGGTLFRAAAAGALPLRTAGETPCLRGRGTAARRKRRKYARRVRHSCATKSVVRFFAATKRYRKFFGSVTLFLCSSSQIRCAPKNYNLNCVTLLTSGENVVQWEYDEKTWETYLYRFFGNALFG